jgi:hypothetical protein
MNLRNMPRWLAAIMLLGGILVALIGSRMVVANGSIDRPDLDTYYDIVHGAGVLVGIVGIASFGIGAWQYAKRD